ncbi:FtsQ-type POTRA domain-containing protein [Anabaena sp. UHCC 0187]|uniref:cell division protein FtsQ/DivIB n=1 Tax=Anabaena sp. UHCC 0187 TaxID=2590018 RepID=UPI001445E770|nr:FtsQ-type POTRA domain-containing protein [Anabaena sp. UHCC 0187]MDP5018327.1 FtsQ-type POTRA domain-containing protein [Dolichospermum sp.]MTJ13934.1 FtsQ-type POTRA domain-containing protein [Anabaena sp. UHCC 0187]
MAGILSVSRINLAQRRQKLRRQRQIKVIQAIWRTVAVTGFASALLWVAIQPMWVLKDSEQIVIKSGDSEARPRTQLLTQKDIYSLLGLSSPQSLWRIEPSVIADSLRKQPHIAQATVNRRLLPPGLIIEIQERVPVAIAQIRKDQAVTNCILAPSFTGKPSNIQSCLQNSNGANQENQLGLLDASGVLMPMAKYISINPKVKLPQMIVIGLTAQYKLFWTQMYKAISQSSLKVTEIDFQDPTNLILKTELGNVHLGSPSNKIPEQIQVLVQMRHLPTKVNLRNIDYIDLKNPTTPVVQVNQKSRLSDK